MSVAVISKWKQGMTVDAYQRLIEAMGLTDTLPKDCESHTAGVAEDGTFIISDVWATTEAFKTFEHERLEPTIDVLNIPAPDMVTVLSLVRNSAATRAMT